MAANSIQELIKDGLKKSYKQRFKNRRTKFEIIVDILSVSRHGALKTQVVYRAKLNYNRVDRYLTYLERNGFIENRNAHFSITKKGEEFLRDYSTMKAFIT